MDQKTHAPLIDIRNATIYRGDTRVFENFSVSIGQHEQAAILGPNGSGKTTLLKVINREIYPVRQDDSWVRILGRETWNVWELRSRYDNRIKCGLVGISVECRDPWIVVEANFE
jgi:ABC-type molybdenum transport system ATPase subunit/photorepair protein PhrA